MPAMKKVAEVEADVEFFETPSAANNDREEWIEKQRPFEQTGKLLEGAIRCYFHDELEELRGDADEIELRTVYFDAEDGLGISFQRIWY